MSTEHAESVAAAVVIPPGHWLGMLGGGQLGRLFSFAAHSLGYKVCVLDPDPLSPAGAVADEHLRAAYDDETALLEIASRCRAVSLEFENVPAGALRKLAALVPVRPSAEAVAVAQDRIVEKRFLVANGIDLAPHGVVERIDDIQRAAPGLFPALLKTARLGYDGKGQHAVDTREQAIEAWSKMGRPACVLERRMMLVREISCIVARGADGTLAVYPPFENEHRNGILAVSIAPARVSRTTAATAAALAQRIAIALEYVGVLCVEMFVIEGGRVLVNEIAPRPHNSGHLTLDASAVSQFEQQVRALAGLPLGSTAQLLPAVMLNVLGDVWLRKGYREEPAWDQVLAVSGAKLHLYGKAEPRPGRKMGHVTCLGASLDDALERAVSVAAALGIAPPR
jgi:5-(carboxyamino)imidazole ribonucleotide synthase